MKRRSDGDGPTSTPPSQERRIWIVLPAFNEEEALPLLIPSLRLTMEPTGIRYSIIIVNDGSNDRTLEIARALCLQHPVLVVDNGINKGLAATVRAGLTEAAARASSSDVIVVMDADNTHPVDLIHRMVQDIEKGSDVVIASRYRPGSRIVGLGIERRVLSRCAALLLRLLFPMENVRDYTCGYRAYRASVVKRLFQEGEGGFMSSKGFSCMVEILLCLREEGATVTEVPLILRYDQKRGASKLKIGSTIVDTLRILVLKKIRAPRLADGRSREGARLT